MAAADEWGAQHYHRLDPLMVARSSDDADTAMHSGKTDIDVDFPRMPYADDERADPTIRRVMDSFDIAGPHNVGVVVTTAQFRDANPALCAALVGAITQADTFIKQSRGAAAEIYDSTEKNDDIPVEVLTDMLGDPDAGFAPTPSGMLRFSISSRPTRSAASGIAQIPGSSFFFPEIYKLPGS